MCVLAVLVVPSLLASDLPRLTAWPLAMAALTAGAWSMAREMRRPACDIVIEADGRAIVDGQPVEAFAVAWRGPLAFLRWRDVEGCPQHRSFWPDTLPARQRRELRLAARERSVPPETGGMAH